MWTKQVMTRLAIAAVLAGSPTVIAAVCHWMPLCVTISVDDNPYLWYLMGCEYGKPPGDAGT